MRKIIISEEFDPYFNIAAEHQLFLASDEDIHLFLWQNESSVIVGRNQNLYAECNLPYLLKNHIKPVRRFSGGGAVYHDKGNVNFTFISKEKTANHTQFIYYIQSAMKAIGVNCEFSGRNDLLYKNQKFSGHAYYSDGDNYMYHGTVMVNVNFEQLGIALTPSLLKLKSKGINSVKNRVINLSEINKEITTKNVIQAFMKTFSCKTIDYINKKNLAPPLETLLSSNDWLYGESPEFDIELERKFSFGNISLHISITNGLMHHVKINTDSLYLIDWETCEASLNGKHFSEEIVWKNLEFYISNQLKLL